MVAIISGYSVEDAVKIMLEAMSIDLTDPNYKDTPKRVAKAYAEILRFQNPQDLKSYMESILSKSFPADYKGIVSQKGIKSVSMCPHHMQPIHYSIDIGYVAAGDALGLSKITRIAEAQSARMVLQETLTEDIANIFANELGSAGVMVIVRGKHGCMTNRGVKQEVITTTSVVKGLFVNDAPLRQEFLALNN
jgi:GTP cyclohydrolase I